MSSFVLRNFCFCLIVDVSHCRFRSITKQYFRKADGVVVMYDVTSETSFTNVRNWMTSVQVRIVVVVVMLFYVHCKQLWSCLDGQLT